MITYYLTLSEKFPSTHPRSGEDTNFEHSLYYAKGCTPYCSVAAFCDRKCLAHGCKLHTIRANYAFWAKRFEKIQRGEACLSIRQWVGKPYGKGSTMRELMRLTREDGIGIQKLEFTQVNLSFPKIDEGKAGSYPRVKFHDLAKNDGLNDEDWLCWFRDYDLHRPMAIIHFTSFRY